MKTALNRSLSRDQQDHGAAWYSGLWPMRFLALIVFSCLVGIANAGGLLSSMLPAWPISSVGDPIPEGTLLAWSGMGELCPGSKLTYASFPSKKNHASDPLSRDPGSACDDGDMTLFNGLLCAADVRIGCQAVRNAQGESGEWFRSPHVRWFWSNRCVSAANKPDEKTFREICAKSFSPDMVLGVMLYELESGELSGFRKWLIWLDKNAKETRLCKQEGDKFVDCQKIAWPRVCSVDMGYDDPGEKQYKINGRVGGRCVLRPADALDFSAVSEATAIPLPPIMSQWDIESRITIRAVKSSTLGGLLDAAPTLLIMSSVEGDYFPLHLDAVRVLMRLMIRNPTLKLSNLPDLPDPQSDLLGRLGIAESNATDPISIHAAAQIIASRARWNPFYRLLADGPTPDVRKLILDRCPLSEDVPSRAYWLWEKNGDIAGDGLSKNDKRHSMGWDCLFVGKLFNKMRVRKDFVKELLDTFLKYADQLEKSLAHLGQLLQLAEVANAVSEQAFKAAEGALRSAHDFVDKDYARQRNTAAQSVDTLNRTAEDLNSRKARIEDQLNDLQQSALTLPNTVRGEIEKEACKHLPSPVNRLCRKFTEMGDIANPEKAKVLDAIARLKPQRDLVNASIHTTADQIAQQTKIIVDLDSRLQAEKAHLKGGTLQTAERVALVNFKIKSQALAHARRLVSEARRADSKVNGYLSVWNGSRASN